MNDFLYLIRVIVVNFSVKTHEMNEAYIQAPPAIKTEQSDKENTEDTLVETVQRAYTAVFGQKWLIYFFPLRFWFNNVTIPFNYIYDSPDGH